MFEADLTLVHMCTSDGLQRSGTGEASGRRSGAAAELGFQLSVFPGRVR